MAARGLGSLGVDLLHHASHHHACRREYDRVVNGRAQLMTTELVVAELHALALRRANPSVARAIAERITRSHRIRVVTPGPNRIEAALALLQKPSGPSAPLIALIDRPAMDERDRTRLPTGSRRIRVCTTFAHRRSIGRHDIRGRSPHREPGRSLRRGRRRNRGDERQLRGG